MDFLRILLTRPVQQPPSLDAYRDVTCDALDLAKLPAEERERGERDRPLLEVAGRVRAKRLERAREALG